MKSKLVLIFIAFLTFLLVEQVEPVHAASTNSEDYIIWKEVGNMRSFSEGLAATESLDGKWGYINTEGEWIIEPQYVYAYEFSEGLALVAKSIEGNHYYGFINHDGDEVIPIGTENFRDRLGYVKFKDGLALLCSGSWCGGIDKTGQKMFELPDSIFNSEPFSNGYALVNIRVGDFDTQYGYINTKGELVYTIENSDGSIQDTYAYSFNEDGFAEITKDNRSIILDKSFNEVNFGYDKIKGFNDGYSVAQKGEVCYLIDTTGTSLFTISCESGTFSDGLIKTPDGYVDNAGTVIVKAPADSIDSGPFTNGVAFFRMNDKKIGIFDKTGEILVDPVADTFKTFNQISKVDPIYIRFNEDDVTVLLGSSRRWGILENPLKAVNEEREEAEKIAREQAEAEEQAKAEELAREQAEAEEREKAEELAREQAEAEEKAIAESIAQEQAATQTNIIVVIIILAVISAVVIVILRRKKTKKGDSN